MHLLTLWSWSLTFQPQNHIIFRIGLSLGLSLNQVWTLWDHYFWVMLRTNRQTNKQTHSKILTTPTDIVGVGNNDKIATLTQTKQFALCRSVWVGFSSPSVCLSVCLFVCLFCPQHNSKTTDYNKILQRLTWRAARGRGRPSGLCRCIMDTRRPIRILWNNTYTSHHHHHYIKPSSIDKRNAKPQQFSLKQQDDQSIAPLVYIYIYIYIYMCVCVCVCVNTLI